MSLDLDILKYVCVYYVFRDRVSLCSPGSPRTHSVDQAGLELRNPSASVSLPLPELKACATMPGPGHFLAALCYYQLGFHYGLGIGVYLACHIKFVSFIRNYSFLYHSRS